MKRLLAFPLFLLLATAAWAIPTVHQAALTWTQTTDTTVDHDCVYRGTVSGGPYTPIFCSAAKTPITAYLDLTVQGGQTYYYVTTAVDQNGEESAYSNEYKTVIPQTVLPNTNLQVASQ